MNRVVACALLLALLGATVPLERELRKAAPPQPTRGIGLGKLGGSVLTGVMRPLLLYYLWVRVDGLTARGRTDELLTLYRTMVDLYPDNERARLFLGWTLAFNLKRDVPDPRASWAYAREGLDILRECDGGDLMIARWMLWQAGQHPHDLRYEGRRWRNERALRERVAAWYESAYGRRLDRFEAALDRLGEPSGFERALLYTNALVQLVYDDWVRLGRAPRVRDAVTALEGAATVAEDPQVAGPLLQVGQDVAAGYRADAALLRHIARGEDLSELPDDYRIGVALWGIGARRDDPGEAVRHLEAAARILATADNGYAEELEKVRGWIAFKRDPTRPRPPLPFD
jgi:hypothetical protein